MAMAENDSNVIEHLLEVESVASSYTNDANAEATKILNAAKAKADQEYLSKVSEKTAELEKAFEEDSAKIKEKVTLEINSYKESITKSTQDTVAFNSLMDRLVLKK